MKLDWILARTTSGELFLRTRRSRSETRSHRVCTVQSAVKLLRRSRRHVYRYIQAGVLKPRANVLGDWLLDAEQVRTLARMPKTLRRPPARFQSLFPDYPLDILDPYRDWRLIMGRILDRGGPEEIRWLFRRYPAPLTREFLSHEGRRLLSSKSFRFWCLYARWDPGTTPSWREPGRRWGGVA